MDALGLEAIKRTWIYRAVHSQASYIDDMQLPKDLVDEFALKVTVRVLCAAVPKSPQPAPEST